MQPRRQYKTAVSSCHGRLLRFQPTEEFWIDSENEQKIYDGIKLSREPAKNKFLQVLGLKFLKNRKFCLYDKVTVRTCCVRRRFGLSFLF